MMFDLAKPLYPALFATVGSDPEAAHQSMLNALSRLERSRYQPWGRLMLSQLEQSFCLSNERLSQDLWGLQFPNPVGLAAGFDKNGVAAGIWSSFGFGFAELGAVTLHAQPGNPRPRLFRLPPDRAALNRMGANNLGAAAIANSLQETWRTQPRRMPIGINLCKSKITPLPEAAQDYTGSFRLLKDWADYFVVNVSSPNTPGLRSLQATEQLEPILAALQAANTDNQPILLKISPDLEWEAIAALLDLAKSYRLAGIIATNTTTRRDNLATQTLKQTGQPIENEAGGISGVPVRQRSTEIIRFIWQQTGKELPIIGVGGIFTPEDAWEKIAAGASLLQIYTGWIYEGPWMVRRILEGLGKRLQERGLAKLTDAIGIGN